MCRGLLVKRLEKTGHVEGTAVWSCVQICVWGYVLGVQVESVVKTSSVVEWFCRSLGAQCGDSRGG